MKKFTGFLLLMMALFSACRDKVALDNNGMPEKLVIAHFNTGDAPAMKKGLEPMRLYLQKKLGMEVEYIFTNDYTSVIEALRSKKVHIAYLSPFSYVLASQAHDITPIACKDIKQKLQTQKKQQRPKTQTQDSQKQQRLKTQPQD